MLLDPEPTCYERAHVDGPDTEMRNGVRVFRTPLIGKVRQKADAPGWVQLVDDVIVAEFGPDDLLVEKN